MCIFEWVQVIGSISDGGTTLVEIQRAILVYLVEHPDAKDTVEGIMAWWLSNAWSRAADVERALEELLQAGWIIATNRALTNTVYGLDKTRLNDVRKFLAS